ncbi:hypothetical protein V2G26_019637 [Clonostachys chloroleuca]
MRGAEPGKAVVSTTAIKRPERKPPEAALTHRVVCVIIESHTTGRCPALFTWYRRVPESSSRLRRSELARRSLRSQNHSFQPFTVNTRQGRIALGNGGAATEEERTRPTTARRKSPTLIAFSS